MLNYNDVRFDSYDNKIIAEENGCGCCGGPVNFTRKDVLEYIEDLKSEINRANEVLEEFDKVNKTE
jgi:hypothetical protein